MNTQEREQLRREECRHVVLAYLHDRPAAAQAVHTIASILRTRGHDFAYEEVQAACLHWDNSKDLEAICQPGGAIPHYRITSQGNITHERTLV